MPFTKNLHCMTAFATFCLSCPDRSAFITLFEFLFKIVNSKLIKGAITVMLIGGLCYPLSGHLKITRMSIVTLMKWKVASMEHMAILKPIIG